MSVVRLAAAFVIYSDGYITDSYVAYVSKIKFVNKGCGDLDVSLVVCAQK